MQLFQGSVLMIASLSRRLTRRRPNSLPSLAKAGSRLGGTSMRRNLLVLLVLALVGSLLAVAAAGAEGTPSVLPPRGPTPETWMPPSGGVPPSEDSNYLDQSRRAYADDYNAILKGGVLVPVASSGFDPINPPTGLVAPGVAIPSGGDEWSYDAKAQKWTSPTGADPFPGEQRVESEIPE